MTNNAIVRTLFTSLVCGGDASARKAMNTAELFEKSFGVHGH